MPRSNHAKTDPVASLFKRLAEVDRTFNKLDKAYVSKDTCSNYQSESMEHCTDLAETLRMQISFTEPTTSEGAAALIIIGNLFNGLVSGVADRDSAQAKSDERAALRCYCAAARFLATEEQLSAPNTINTTRDLWTFSPQAESQASTAN